ncbi:MAG: hypothetical protein JNK64_14270 [Myxococcales bacterium]|nr:hypothetical protein [Myxococcales bacterium]
MSSELERAACSAAWANATARELDTRHRAAARAFVDALAAAYANGAVVYAEFEVDLDAAVFAMAADPARWADAQLLERLWHLPGVARGIPRLGARRADVASYFELADLAEVGDFLEQAVRAGGAYSAPMVDTARSRTLGEAFARELMDAPDALVLIARSAWCEFFHDVAWDVTVVVLAPSRRQVKLLLATDVD